MQKRIVVLGGVGFVGSHLCRRLLDEGHEIFAIDIRDVAHAPLLREISHHPAFHYIHHNIIHPFGIRCNEIYNLASPARLNYNKVLPVETLKVGMVGSIHALDTARSERARVVYASSGAVGEPVTMPIDGTVTTRQAVTECQRSAEALHRAYRTEFGVDTRIARLYNSYGTDGHLMDQRVVMKMVVAALQNRDIIIEGSGEQVRSFGWVEDMVEGLIRLMQASPTEATRTIELGSDEEISILALAEQIIRLTGSKSKIGHIEPRSDEHPRRVPDLRAAHNELGWRPTTSLNEGLMRTIAYAEKELSTRAGVLLSWIEINN